MAWVARVVNRKVSDGGGSGASGSSGADDDWRSGPPRPEGTRPGARGSGEEGDVDERSRAAWRFGFDLGFPILVDDDFGFLGAVGHGGARNRITSDAAKSVVSTQNR